MIESYFRCESDDSSEEGGGLNPRIDFSISNDVHNTEKVDEDTVERTLVEDNMKSSSRGLNKNINATCIVGNNAICKVEVILILPVAVSKKVPSCQETTNCTINFLDQVKTWKKEDSKLKTSSYQNFPNRPFPGPEDHPTTKSPSLEMPEGRNSLTSVEDFGPRVNVYSLDENTPTTSNDTITTSTPTPIADDTGGKFEPTLDFSVMIEGKVKS